MDVEVQVEAEDINLLCEFQRLQTEYKKLQEYVTDLESKYSTDVVAKQQEDDNFNNQLYQVVVDLFGKQQYSDITILLEDGQRFYGHKLVLSTRSDVWNDRNLETEDQIDLSDVKYEVVYYMLKWVYTDIFDDFESIGYLLLLDLLKTTKRCRLQELYTRCQEALKLLVDKDNCRIINQVAEELSDESLMEHSSFFVAEIMEAEDMDNQTDDNDSGSDNLVLTFGLKSPTTVNRRKKGSKEKSSLECPKCDKKFKTEDDVNKHFIAAHTKFCNICEKNHGRTMVNTYTWKETGEKKNICRVCMKNNGTEFKSKIVLDKYFDKRFMCDICGKSNRCESHLVSHRRVHTGEKPFKCETCGQGFASKTSCSRHELTHTGVKMYKCEECDRTFARGYHLQRHRLIHSGEKPFQCPVCGRLFRQTNTLQVHARTHTGERPYNCPHCERAFSDRRSLLKHWKNSHTETYTHNEHDNGGPNVEMDNFT
ncbi:hypothetical protein SNE40_011098 [Patella caerulea]|uniref:Uncharacterized protein n=1 Tax=Patella caerulea TaxID=87958 RepID=A0AAN8JX99_PATCE